MDGRLLLVVGLFAVVFAAGVGQSVVAETDAPFSQVVDEAVDAGGADPATPAADGTEREGRSDESSAAGESGDADSSGDGESGTRSAADGTNGAEGAPADEATDAGDSAGPPFRFEIEQIERCGRTCRDVTATLVNGQDETASDLVVETAIYAGNDTNEGDRVWKGSERVGSLSADAEHRSTRRVDLGWGGGLAVKRADGWITVETTVETADRSVTLERQRDVT